MNIDGKKIAEEMLLEIGKAVALRRAQGESLRLAAILVGSSSKVQPPDPLAVEPLGGLRKFLELKKKAAEKIGVDFRIYKFPANITTQKLRKEIVGIAKARVNHGALVELPLPPHINTQYILNAIPPEKDPDVLSEKAQGAFFADRSKVLPPAVEAAKIIFEKYGIEPRGKSCAVFGYGLLVGKPISHWLALRGATVSIINEFTLNPNHYTLNADIIISGVGKPNLIKADMIRDGAVVIDFGHNQQPATNLVGDVDFEGVSKKSSLITPIPGGVGPVVVAAVLKNLITLLK